MFLNGQLIDSIKEHGSLGDWGLDSGDRSIPSNSIPLTPSALTSRHSSFSVNSDDSFPGSPSDSGSVESVSLAAASSIADVWGVGILTTDSLSTLPLGQAVTRRDVESVRKLLDEDPQCACVRDKEGNNLLHLMADSRVSDPAKARLNWADTINTTREIVKILIEYRVDIEARNQSRMTPLYVPFRKWLMPYSERSDGAQKGWLEGHAVIALIEAGANIEIDLGNGDRRESFYDNLLEVWIHGSCEDFCHSETYRDVLLSIMQRVEDLEPPNTYLPLVHRVIRAGTGPHSGEALRCLTSKLHSKPASVDSLNREEDTPLLALLISNNDVSKDFPDTALELTIDTAKALLECGARIDFTSESGNTAILSAVSSHRTRWRSDDEDVQLMDFLLNFDRSIDDGLEPGCWRLINITPTAALTNAVCMGRPKTVKFLLEHGMHDRLNKRVTFEYRYDLEYIQLVDPEAHPDIYREGSEFDAENWAYFRLSEAYTYGNRERAKAIGKSRYHGHSEVVKILQSYGIERTRPKEPDNEPTYFNEVTMPRSSFFNFSAAGVSTTELREGEIPRNEDWKFLYELEILDEQWESKGLPQLAFIYTKLRAWPRPQVLNRWPQLQTMIPPKGDRAWYLNEFWLHVWNPPRPESEKSASDDQSDGEPEFGSYYTDSDSQEYEDDQSFDSSDPDGDDHNARSGYYDSEGEGYNDATDSNTNESSQLKK
ncbi:hypothetical protein TWF481_007782 [Arthrobotrys musiformis]|uniref:Ankyrin n=1 Tax=Arthrobotrys musiformis TaxID=47236 RepID=A0AAV9WE21_9PEZI